MGIEISKDIQSFYEEVKEIRRELHKIPETAFLEQKTSQFIASYLKNIGLEVKENIAITGLIAYIPGYRGEKTYAFRTDMDGLSILEDDNKEYSSIHKGKMHACGHDGHMASLLILAKYLYQNKALLKDNILFIFQPAEEGPGGALPMIKEGILKEYNVDAIFGTHIYPNIEEGKIGSCPGPMMAQNGEVEIYIQGKGSHGARPHEGKDSIVIAAQMINGLQTIISRDLDPADGRLITIGTIEGGEAINVVASQTILKGSIRAFKEEVYLDIKDGIKNLAKGLEVTYQCEIDVILRDLYPGVNNDRDLFNILLEVIPEKNFELISPLMISEDFAFFQKEVPGLFILLGSKNKEKGFIHGLHSNKFNFDERVLIDAIQVYVNILVELSALRRD